MAISLLPARAGSSAVSTYDHILPGLESESHPACVLSHFNMSSNVELPVEIERY